MNADELEDTWNCATPRARLRSASNLDIRDGRTRPAEDLLQDLKAATTKSSRRSRYRELEKLASQHAGLPEILRRVIDILKDRSLQP